MKLGSTHTIMRKTPIQLESKIMLPSSPTWREGSFFISHTEWNKRVGPQKRISQNKAHHTLYRKQAYGTPPLLHLLDH